MFFEAFYNIIGRKIVKAYTREKLQRKNIAVQSREETVVDLQAVFGRIAWHTERNDNNTSMASAMAAAYDRMLEASFSDVHGDLPDGYGWTL